jgi:hypothetical protein
LLLTAAVISTKFLRSIPRPDTIFGTAGNTGPVYAGGVLVTKDQKLSGSRAGTHLHGPQIRKCRKVKSPDGYLICHGFGPYPDKVGFYYEIVDYENGLNGCIDPTPFWTGMYATDAPRFISIYQTLVPGLTAFVHLSPYRSLLKRDLIAGEPTSEGSDLDRNRRRP